MLIKRCPLGSSECALFIVAQLLPRLLGGKSSVATKTHSEEQKSNSKGQQALESRIKLNTQVQLLLKVLKFGKAQLLTQLALMYVSH
ncbi:hypothetical protein [Pseudoalteromonas sp. NC201]|uniref:hypothetical protein n=1 Tax=Pseudoalteromonas sp. NC201 TaxID=1514074 RepID=UPI000C7BD547|nr:hypothetical protein [Pseudoalteromonas sp. NC201]